MKRLLFGSLSISSVCLLLVLFSAPVSIADPPPNIILFVADDLGWNDLPFFSNPVDRSAYPDEFPTLEESEFGHRGEPARISGGWNRFAARVFADRVSGDFGTFQKRAVDSDDTTDEYSVVPVDHPIGSNGPYVPGGEEPSGSPAPTVAKVCKETAKKTHRLCSMCNADCTQSTTGCCSDCCDPAAGDDCCEPATDVLDGFGGLARLATEGVAFSRFYANSSKCGPSRAALFTGRYPRRVGVTINGGEVSSHEVTIAEFLKQGCTKPINFPDVNEDFSNVPAAEMACFNPNPTRDPVTSVPYRDGRMEPCPCYIDDSQQCDDVFDAGGCYRTGLIGKWHLGSGVKGPISQGFDEYFGFGGGSRHYWNTRPLQCGPSPNYCANDITTVCRDSDDCPPGGTCEARGLYIGPLQFGENHCEPELEKTAAHFEHCCEPGSGRGKFVYKDKIYNNDLKGKDQRRKGSFPCSDDDPIGLRPDQSQCAYSTRIYRDHARNFIIRNSKRQPYFLTVTFHAPHFGFAAPIRTENHYYTPKHDSPRSTFRAHRPNNAAKYWGIMEEMDAAVGEVLSLLDETAVCSHDPRESCDEDTDCSGLQAGSECLPLGRCDTNGAPCGDTNETSCSGTCQPPSEHTHVMFFSDHGRPHGGSAYGDPDLRGGKGDSFEGGLRVGMLARVPGGTTKHCIDDDTGVVGVACATSAPVCPTGETCELIPSTPAVASIVDVYATVAEIAGYSPNTTAGFYELMPRNCAGPGIGSPCILNSDCEGNVCEDENVPEPLKLVVDGKSFLSTITTPHSVLTARDVVYGSYPGDGINAIARDGLFTDDTSAPLKTRGVCVYDSRQDTDSAIADADRRIRAGSCTLCEPGEDDCSSEWCKLPTGVCLDPDDTTNIEDPCTTGPQAIDDGVCLKSSFPLDLTTIVDPDPVDLTPLHEGAATHGLYRCRSTSDCPTHPDSGLPKLKCKKNVWMKCNQCVTAAWKLKALASGTHDASFLFDMRSNPTEDDRLNFRFDQCRAGLW